MDTFLTLTEMYAHTRALIDRASDRVEVRALGHSAGGRAIDMISLGDGPRSALVIGSPHPNEPVGCVVIQRLIDRFLADPRFLEETGFRWHFIKSIDPDGIALNEGWFKGDRSLSSYLRNFYRPALRLQGEYSFPIDCHGYRFDAVTPENLCWQQALELTRPDLQCSLHNADLGGVFYFVSYDIPDLTAALASQPQRFGLTLNAMGEPELGLKSHAAGVFEDLAIAELIERGVAIGTSPAIIWPAGASSSEYAAARYGTFSCICEVPLWRDVRLNDVSPSTITMTELNARNRAFQDLCSDVASRYLPGLEAMTSTFDERCLLAALRERFPAETVPEPALSEESQPGAFLSVRDAACIDDLNRASGLRPLAMLSRLADMIHARQAMPEAVAASTEAWALLQDQLSGFQRDGGFEPYPIDLLADIQELAILTTARTLRSSPVAARVRDGG